MYYEYNLYDDDVIIKNIIIVESKIVYLPLFFFYRSQIIPTMKPMTSKK